MSLDFSNAELPKLLPLENSFAENEIEADLKRLFIDLFKTYLASPTFDANVLGAAHLGSFDLVRKSVNTDGLVLLQGDREEAATRYLYRAWKSGDVQGRGLHFLRTYLQMLFPNGTEVEQLWHDKSSPYPTALYTLKPSPAWWIHQVGEPGLKLDGSWGIGRAIPGAEETRKNRTISTEGKYLTSRVQISMDMTDNDQSVSSLIHIIRSVIPARLVPIFNFWLKAAFGLSLSMTSALAMDKEIQLRHPWCGRVITDRADAKWKLGKDGEPAKLPAPFGSFKVGKLYGKNAPVQLRSCRIVSNLNISMQAEMPAWRVETIPPDPDPEYMYPDPPMTLNAQYLNVDGSWTLDGRKIATYPKLSELKIISNKPPVLLPPKPARLTLSGRWKLGGRMNPDLEITTIS